MPSRLPDQTARPAPPPRQAAKPRAGALPVFHRLDAETAPPEVPFVALVPGALAPLLELELPAGLSGAAREGVARRMAADRIGAAIGTGNGNGNGNGSGNGGGIEARPCALAGAAQPWTRVIVADAARLQAWRRQLAPHRARLRALLPDYLALPGAEGLWTIEGQDGGGIVARLGLDDGFAAEDTLAALLLEKALARGPAPGTVLRLGAPAPATDATLAAAGLRVARDPAVLTPPPQRLAHRELWLDLATDLGAETERLHRGLKAWRLPVALAVLALAVWAGAQATAIASANTAAQEARARAEALTRAHFVPEGPILDIRTQVARALAEAAAAAGPGAAARPVAQFRTAAGVIVARQARLVSAAYAEGIGLTLAVEAANFAELDQLAAAISAAGPRAVLAEAGVRDEGGVAGVISLMPEAGQ